MCVCVADNKVDGERRPTMTFQRAADRTQHLTRRLERRKLQRSRCAFTQRQLEQLEQGLSHAVYIGRLHEIGVGA